MLHARLYVLHAHWRISAHPGRGRPGGIDYCSFDKNGRLVDSGVYSDSLTNCGTRKISRSKSNKIEGDIAILLGRKRQYLRSDQGPKHTI